MRNTIDTSVSVTAIATAVFVCLALAPTAPAQGSAATSPSTRPARAQTQPQPQTQPQANPEIERQRKEAQQEAEKTLDKDARAAIEETQRAILAIDAQKPDEAVAAIERATGKINVLLARNPAAALIPVHAEVRVIDLAPVDARAIREIARAAERAVEHTDYPEARVLLDSLISEIRVRTYDLPLASYPAALREAARLLDQKSPTDARAVLLAALNAIVVIENSRPLPIILAQEAIDQAQAEVERDRAAARVHLAVAREQLERAKLLGYAGQDPEYDALQSSISDLENQLKGNENTTSAFARLKEKLASFFKRHSPSENRTAGR